jgi:hypothetical protein
MKRDWHSIMQKKKRRRFFRCGRKKGFLFTEQAAFGMDRLQNRQGADRSLTFYHCGHCKGYHVGRDRNIYQ